MKTGKQKVIGDINITPLTDVFLVLLIIMMVVNPLLQVTGISTVVNGEGDAADTPAQEDTEKLPAITVSVDAQGAYFMGGDALDDEAIKSQIRNEAAKRDALGQDKEIVLEVDPLAPFERTIAIMDFGRSAGINNISISKAPPPAEEQR